MVNIVNNSTDFRTGPNEIESLISCLKVGQAIHLGHSSVIANFGGLRLGLDLTTIDGMVPAPFSNLTLSGSTSVPYLLPLLDKQSMIARPHMVADSLDVLIYSHLHSDHFSLRYVAAAKAKNPNLRIICPPHTRDYLLRYSHGRAKTKLIDLIIRRIITSRPLANHAEETSEFLKEIRERPEARINLIDAIEEIDPSLPISFQCAGSDILLSAFFTVHPSFQLYVRLPFENSPPPPTTGYTIEYLENGSRRSAILIGEGATDPATLRHIFNERDQLAIVFFPTTEQPEPKGLQLVEELVAHASLRTLVLLERIVKENTKIVPLHQGLWYFQVSPTDIVNARIALHKLAKNQHSILPFVSLTREFQVLYNSSTFNPPSTSSSYLTHILRTSWRRWAAVRRIATASIALPIVGQIEGFPPGKLINFSKTEKALQQVKTLSKEVLHDALQAHFTEYQGLRQEIDSGWEWQKDLLQYILLIIGTAVTLVSTFPNKEALYIAASIMLSALGWSYLEQSIRMVTVGRYLKSELNPRVNSLLLELEELDIHTPIASKVKVWMWEDFFRGGNLRTALMGIAAMGKFAFAVLPGFCFALAFYFSKHYSQTTWLPFESIMFTIAVGVSFLPLATAILNGRFAFSGER